MDLIFINKKIGKAKTCRELIKAFSDYYTKKWKNKNNEEVIDEFYGHFLVDLEAVLLLYFPEVKPFIQSVKPNAN